MEAATDTGEGYSGDFFETKYAPYLKEPGVRRVHDRMLFEWFMRVSQWGDYDPGILRVVDIGCGLGEFYDYGVKKFPDRFVDYVGLDLNPRTKGKSLSVDYLERDWVGKLPFAPDAFVSLFSLEPVLSANQRYDYYDWLFTIPTMRVGISVGFYYADRAGAEWVMEAGGALKSYQTIEPMGRDNGTYTEERVIIRNPSKLFGPHAIEVWKFFKRNA